MEKIKLKVGEVFTYKDKTYQVVEVETDEGCAFEFSSCCTSLLGDCSPTHRTDGASVIFKEINNMENNQLTINIPKGMEIDLEKSDLTKGIVKFKKKNITYDDILKECPTNFNELRVRNHCLNKIIAISQLIHIAKYYNGDWKPDWSNIDEYKYYIIYDGSDNTYTIADNSVYTYSNIYFKNSEDAIAVINNPNFRDILDAIYKN